MPAERNAWTAALRAGGGLTYNWGAQRGVLVLPPDMDAPSMTDVCDLFEALDGRCTCVIVVDPAGEILASFERSILGSVPWWDASGAVQH